MLALNGNKQKQSAEIRVIRKNREEKSNVRVKWLDNLSKAAKMQTKKKNEIYKF